MAASSEAAIFFYKPTGEWAAFSQFYESPFEVGGVTYRWAEQWMQVRKAEHFKDDTSRRKIVDAESPEDCKKLGRGVKPFDKKEWDEVVYEYVKHGNRLKFNESERKDGLRTLLLSTGEREIVEAAPRDRRWGIGFGAKTAAARPRTAWGENWLGKILMEIRRELRREQEEGSRVERDAEEDVG